jgi:hypothetical protein
MRRLLAILTIAQFVVCERGAQPEEPQFPQAVPRSTTAELCESESMPPTIPRNATDLAGFTLAHAVWSVSDTTPSELLCPLAFIDGPDGRTLTRFEAPSQEAAIHSGKVAMAELTRKGVAWAFAREGTWRTSESSAGDDAIIVDTWVPGLSHPVSIVQLFQRASAGQGFRVRSAVLVVDGALAPEPLAAATVAAVREAVASHSAVKDLWPTWQSMPDREH